MLGTKQLSKVGIGTWGLGGYMQIDSTNNYASQISGVAYSLKSGMNYLESVYMYAEGKAINIAADAYKMSGISREDVFLVLSIYQSDAHSIEEAEDKITNFLKQFNTNYLDNVQFTMGFILLVGLRPIERLVRKLIKHKGLRYSGVVNANLDVLKQYYSILGDTQFSHELCFNFEIRDNEILGITQWAIKKGIKNIVYQPLRRNRTAKRKWPLLVKLSQKYKRDQNQILLNWIVSKGYYPIVKSTNPYHIRKNLESFNFQISNDDLKLLNGFRVPGYISPSIDWLFSGNGFEIAQLPDVFDKEYDNQLRNTQRRL